MYCLGMFGPVLTALAVGLAAVLGPGPAGVRDVPAEAGEYVSLGDSYTAAPLVPPQAPGPVQCARSAANYPHRLAEQFGFTLIDVSCAGATTADLTAARA